MSPRFDSLITTMGLMLDGDTTTAKWRAIISGLLLTTLPRTLAKYRPSSTAINNLALTYMAKTKTIV